MNPRILLLLLCLVSAASTASIEAYQFDSAQKEADYNRLIDELRCLVCQNQNLAESDADLARDLRRITYEMLSSGKTSDEVVDFMVARYGDFVLYRPPFKPGTYLLWFGPAVLLALVLVLVARRLRRGRAAEVDAEQLSAARKLLEDDEPRS